MSEFAEIVHRLLVARGQSRSAKSVEVFGWLILFEGSLVVLFPHFVALILNLPALVEQAANYFRLVGLLVSGAGYALHCQRSIEWRGICFRVVAGPAACALRHGYFVVSRNYPRTLSPHFFHSRFRQLHVDTKSLARRITEAELNRWFYAAG